jgi:hypothetical protein
MTINRWVVEALFATSATRLYHQLLKVDSPFEYCFARLPWREKDSTTNISCTQQIISNLLISKRRFLYIFGVFVFRCLNSTHFEHQPRPHTRFHAGNQGGGRGGGGPNLLHLLCVCVLCVVVCGVVVVDCAVVCVWRFLSSPFKDIFISFQCHSRSLTVRVEISKSVHFECVEIAQLTRHHLFLFVSSQLILPMHAHGAWTLVNDGRKAERIHFLRSVGGSSSCLGGAWHSSLHV